MSPTGPNAPETAAPSGEPPGSTRSVRWELALVPIALLAIAADLLIRRDIASTWSPTMWPVFLGSAASSLLIASALVRWLGVLRTHAQRAAVLVVSVVSVAWCWTVVLSLGYFVNMGSLPVPSAIRYLLQEPSSTLSLIGPYLVNPVVLIPMTATPLAVGMLWWIAAGKLTAGKLGAGATRPGLSGAKIVRVVAPLLAVCIIVGLSLKPPKYRFAVADVHAFLMGTNMVRLAAKGDAQRLSKPHRIALGQLKRPAIRPNVLLIVNETYGSSALSLYGCKANTTPQTDAFVRAHADTVTLFPDAQSNAGRDRVCGRAHRPIAQAPRRARPARQHGDRLYRRPRSQPRSGAAAQSAAQLL